MNARGKGQTWPSSELGKNSAEPTPRTLYRLAAGDPGALAEVYEAYGPAAYRMAFRVTGSIPDAQDVVQDLFVALPEVIASFRGESSFVPWFRRCAARQALLHLRKRRRRREVTFEPDRAGAFSTQPLHAIELDGALGRLPETLRVVVILREVEGFSHEDVGRMLGISPVASRMRLMRARKQLREMLVPLSGGQS